MRRVVLNGEIPENITYIDRSTSGYIFTQIDSYNNYSKYLKNKKYLEMPESFQPGWQTITTNNGLVLIYKGNDGIIYDLFPQSLDEEKEIDDIKLVNTQNTTSNYILTNKQSYHSVVCKESDGYLEPQCNIISSDFHGTIDMDLPNDIFKCSNENCTYCKHGLYKFSDDKLTSFYIKAKPYLYISTGTPELINAGSLEFIQCSENIYYIANITNEAYINFALTGTDDCIVEFM